MVRRGGCNKKRKNVPGHVPPSVVAGVVGEAMDDDDEETVDDGEVLDRAGGDSRD